MKTTRQQPFERPTREQMLMDIAEVASKRSTCSRANVGVVIAHEGRVLCLGYNGSPAGMPHCDHTYDPPDYPGCRVTVHAEANAIAFSAKHGIRLFGSELYTTFSPCLSCAQLIINAGIVRVYIKNEYRLRDGEILLQSAGIDIIKV
jgi:dCMP deaminase